MAKALKRHCNWPGIKSVKLIGILLGDSKECPVGLPCGYALMQLNARKLGLSRWFLEP